MKHLTTKLSLAAASAVTYLGLASSAFATGGSVNPCPSQAGFSGLCKMDANNIGTVISTAITIVLIFAAVIALFFLVWGGIRWITSGGDKAKVEGARNTIIAAIVGLVLALLAFFIIQIVLGFFGLSLATLTLPKFTK